MKKDIRNQIIELIISFEKEIDIQKEKAHKAIDLPDWEETQKLLSATNANISQINQWIKNLKDLQSETEKADFLSDPIVNDISIKEEKTHIKYTNNIDNYEKEWLSLNDDFQSKKVVGLYFLDRNYSVSSLTESLIKICNILYLFNRTKFNEMLSSPFNIGKNRNYIALKKFTEHYEKIPDTQFYIDICTNSNFKIGFIRHILDYYNISYDKIKFRIKIKK